MTTLAALATKDALVMGCDSLGSFPRPFVDPRQLAVKFFDPDNSWGLKLDDEGNPVLKNLEDILTLSERVPYNHMTHVDKLFSLRPLEMGMMITGLSSIGDRTIKGLIAEFKRKDKVFKTKPKPTNYTVKSVAERFFKFISTFYNDVYPDETHRPYLEFIIGGYDKRKEIPKVYRIYLHNPGVEETINDFGVIFGGQMQEIQRIIFGIDDHNKMKLMIRIAQLYHVYRDKLQEHLDKSGIEAVLPAPEEYKDDLRVFDNWRLDEFEANWGDFSEQNAIECVNFFVEIMIKSQQFSESMPTVGGNVHIGLITKGDGFRFVSKEEWEHDGFSTPKEAANNA